MATLRRSSSRSASREGTVDGGERCLWHGTVMAMLTGDIEECWDQDVWFEQTHHLDHLPKRMFSSPMFERLLARF